MKLKNNISIKIVSLVITSVVTFISCSNEDLTVTSPNDSNVDEIRESANGLNLILVGAYDAYQKVPINEHLITELRSDNGRANTLNGLFPSIDAYRITSTFGEGANYWSNNFITIAQTNIILGAQQNEVNKVVFGEAYFLRALSYFNLIRAYGNVPYIDRFLDQRTQVREFPQLNAQEMYPNIISDLERSIQLLMGEDQPRNRASEGAAKVLLAKVYLSQPTPNYDMARDILQEFIPENNSFDYRLQTNYADVFSRGNELNDEIVFAISYDLSGGSDFITSGADLEDQIQTDAESFSFALTASGPSNGVNLATEDLKTFVRRRGETSRTEVIFSPETIDLEDTQNGKWISSSRNTRAGDVDWIVLRYADVLLLYAEAILENQPNTIDPDAVAAYNRVRNRAFPLDVTPDPTSFTKEQLLDERRAEFAFENQRLYDLIRFNEAIPILTTHSQDPINNFNFSPRDLLLPIPQREIDATGNFYNQNPGY